MSRRPFAPLLLAAMWAFALVGDGGAAAGGGVPLVYSFLRWRREERR